MKDFKLCKMKFAMLSLACSFETSELQVGLFPKEKFNNHCANFILVYLITCKSTSKNIQLFCQICETICVIKVVKNDMKDENGDVTNNKNTCHKL